MWQIWCQSMLTSNLVAVPLRGAVGVTSSHARYSRYGTAAPLKIGIKFSSAYFETAVLIFWITFYINNLHLDVNIHMFGGICWRHTLADNARCSLVTSQNNSREWRQMADYEWTLRVGLQTIVNNQACYSICVLI